MYTFARLLSTDFVLLYIFFWDRSKFCLPSKNTLRFKGLKKITSLIWHFFQTAISLLAYVVTFSGQLYFWRSYLFSLFLTVQLLSFTDETLTCSYLFSLFNFHYSLLKFHHSLKLNINLNLIFMQKLLVKKLAESLLLFQE